MSTTAPPSLETEPRNSPAVIPEPELPPRTLGVFGDDSAGATVVVISGIHGNEPSGYRALGNVLEHLRTSGEVLRGRLVGLVGNRRALAHGVRYLDRDLNRLWSPEARVVADGPGEDCCEELEAKELWSVLREVVSSSAGEVFALDLHSTSGPGPAFVVFDDTLENRRFAQALEVPLILGIEEELEGTMLDFLSSLGVRTVSFEAGQHLDPLSVERAECAIWLALSASGLVDRSHPRVVASRARLNTTRKGLPRVVEVRHRHEIRPESGFRMEPGLAGFEPVASGQIVASEAGQPVSVPLSGLLLMPLYQAQGEDGYFVVRPVRESWLRVSAWLRTFRLEQHVHRLPGVRQLGPGGHEVEVDRRVVRWLPIELFHLLGFRRVGEGPDHFRLRRRTETVAAADVTAV